MSEEARGSHSSLFGHHIENYNIESSALHRKLQSKIEALKIMRSELEKYRTERDQFKLMAETLQLRYSAIKQNTDFCISLGGKSSVATLLNDAREKNMKLSTELETAKQKLAELHGDIELLRAKNLGVQQSRQLRNSSISDAKDEVEWKCERTGFIASLESLKKKNAQLAFDFKALLDEKEEAITERDSYKCKMHRLNHELMLALKANESHKNIIDIDALVVENKYLQDKLKNCESELEQSQVATNRYKSMLETKRKKGIIKLGTNNVDNIMSHKQVKMILENGADLPTKTETIADLKSLCLALLDNLNDKNVALSHQRRTNKILASRIAELDRRLQIAMGQNEMVSFSPSQILLSGYTPSTVDIEPKSSNVTDDSGTMSSDESNKTSQVFDDGMESLTSDSNRSIVSSEYEHAGISSDVSSMYALTNAQCASVSNDIIKERADDLKDLPSELAEMIHRALRDLDSKEGEESAAEQE